MPNVYEDSCDGDYNCAFGHLSFSIQIWLGVLVVAAIVICLVRKGCLLNVNFTKFYSLYRGFFRWFFAPTLFFSIWMLFSSFEASDLSE